MLRIRYPITPSSTPPSLIHLISFPGKAQSGWHFPQLTIYNKKNPHFQRGRAVKKVNQGSHRPTAVQSGNLLGKRNPSSHLPSVARSKTNWNPENGVAYYSSSLTFPFGAVRCLVGSFSKLGKLNLVYPIRRWDRNSMAPNETCSLSLSLLNTKCMLAAAAGVEIFFELCDKKQDVNRGK